MDREQTNAIKLNLDAIGLITSYYDLYTKQTQIKVNKNGIRMYATILNKLGVSQMLKGPTLTSEAIQTNTLGSMETLALQQKFIEFMPLDDGRIKWMLTKRGMEHIKVLFSIGMGMGTSSNSKHWLIKLFSQKG